MFYQYVCSLGIEPTTFCAANAMLYHWATGTPVCSGKACWTPFSAGFCRLQFKMSGIFINNHACTLHVIWWYSLQYLIMSDRTSLQQHLQLPYYHRRYTVYRTPQIQLEWKMNHPWLCAHLFSHEQRCFRSLNLQAPDHWFVKPAFLQYVFFWLLTILW